MNNPNNGLDTTEMMFALAIAFIFPFFFTKLANKLTKYDDIDKSCNYGLSDYSYFYNFNEQNPKVTEEQQKTREEQKRCENERKGKLDKAEFHKHLVLLAVALTAIVISSAIQTKSTKFGVGLGGVFTLIIALVVYWHKYNETSRLVILGLSLLFIMYFSVRLYKIDSIANIFSFEFGTK